MERLTIPNYTYYSLDFMEDGISEMANKLSKYEDTGLTPEQILAMDEEYTKMAKELGEYKKKYNNAMEFLDKCKMQGGDMGEVNYKICDRCGKEMNYRKGWTSKLFGIEKIGSKFKARRYYCGNVTGYDYLDRGIELCVECTEQLNDFLKGKAVAEMGV